VSAVAIVPPPRPERRMTSGLEAAEARSARSRRGQQTRRLARAIAGDRPAGIRYSLDRLGAEGKLRDRCELLFAMGAHLNPLEDAAAVVHVAQLELQAAGHHAALGSAAAGAQEWRSKQAAYTAQAALRGLVTLRLTPSTRKPASSSPEGKARAAAAVTADLARYRA
jgi:hypothetical protein